MSTEADTTARFDAKWAEYQKAPKFHHVTRELDGKLDRESYVYSTPAGSIELWRTPRPEGSTFGGEYYGGVEVHSPKPHYKGQTPVPWHCQWVKGGECYTDGSSMAFDQYEHDFDMPTYIKDELTTWHRRNFEQDES